MDSVDAETTLSYVLFLRVKSLILMKTVGVLHERTYTSDTPISPHFEDWFGLMTAVTLSTISIESGIKGSKS